MALLEQTEESDKVCVRCGARVLQRAQMCFCLVGGDRLATLDEHMMMHPVLTFDNELEPGQLIEIAEGVFRLNDDLNPTQPVDL